MFEEEGEGRDVAVRGACTALWRWWMAQPAQGTPTNCQGLSLCLLSPLSPPLSSLPAELEKVEGEVRNQLTEFARGLDAYKRLGLAFENSEGGVASSNNIRCVMTLINPADPEQRYCFEVHVSPVDDAYAVTACQPPLPALPALVAQLNATNQFSHFIQLMRREFVALARGGGGGRHGREAAALADEGAQQQHTHTHTHAETIFKQAIIQFYPPLHTLHTQAPHARTPTRRAVHTPHSSSMGASSP